ncbi:hypothetical protein E1091_00425 [Micromonospora fluostatini]|uniref:Uncharacterized protein n=1 Tax=Micromonospora fluostatini TaxID=1629071 RepID=A0ABY2DM73_9ACTN|nr:hypothetical protein E1091_00425 [Micromonospora fluostatini]
MVKVRVVGFLDPERGGTIGGDVVEATVSSEGDLSVTVEDRDGNPTGWAIYARGHWSSVVQVEPPAPEVIAAVAERRQAERPRPSRTRF